MSKSMFLAASAVAVFAAASANADVIAQWTFETSIPATAGPHTAEAGVNAATSFASGVHADGATVYSNPVGNGSNESFSSEHWGIGDYYQFTTQTIGYDTITITWDQARSGTGPATFDLIASSDGFATSSVLTAGYAVQISGATGPGTWSSGTYLAAYTFSPVAGGAALANKATVGFRLVAKAAPGGTAGTNRVDNIGIEGHKVPAPASLALVGLAGLTAARRRRA